MIILLLRNECVIGSSTNNTYHRLTINQGKPLSRVNDGRNDDNDGNDYDDTMMSMLLL